MKALKQRNNKTDTLAILSVLVELQKSDNTKLDSLFNATQNVKAMNDTQEFKGIRLGVIFNQTYSFEMACWPLSTTLSGLSWAKLISLYEILILVYNMFLKLIVLQNGLIKINLLPVLDYQTYYRETLMAFTGTVDLWPIPTVLKPQFGQSLRWESN